MSKNRTAMLHCTFVLATVGSHDQQIRGTKASWGSRGDRSGGRRRRQVRDGGMENVFVAWCPIYKQLESSEAGHVGTNAGWSQEADMVLAFSAHCFLDFN
uniref:Uncharacterized protein n=1 Tax=Oryza brachyantha TaxID=4533 RepID=J3MPY4_ORYBR